MGVEQYIKPEDFNADLDLVSQYVGPDIAAALAVGFSGVNIYVSENALRRAKIRWARDLYAKGKSVKQIALELKISEAWAYKILESNSSDIFQPDLFEESLQNGDKNSV